MAPIPIYALNDFGLLVKLPKIDPLTGVVSPLTTGSVTAFLATSNAASATAAHVDLSMTPTFLRVEKDKGVWLIFFDATVLTTALLDPIFGSTPPYLIVQQAGGLRTYALCSYSATRPALVG